jgi:hypothetical protein
MVGVREPVVGTTLEVPKRIPIDVGHGVPQGAANQTDFSTANYLRRMRMNVRLGSIADIDI